MAFKLETLTLELFDSGGSLLLLRSISIAPSIHSAALSVFGASSCCCHPDAL